MKKTLTTRIKEKDLFFSLEDSEGALPEVKRFRRLVEDSLFNQDSEKRLHSQKVIGRYYGKSIRKIDILDGEKIYFEMVMPDGNYTCILGNVSEEHMDSPYYPSLFF